MLDIFTPIVPEEKQHPNFKAMLADVNSHARAVIEGWTKEFVDRDGKIITEFQTTFNSSFWEFYLNACFKELDFKIDYSYDRPDFILKKNETQIAVEATISNHPDGGTPEWVKGKLPQFTPELWFQIIHLSTIRLANAIFTKHGQYIKNYKKLSHTKGLPFILCVAPFDQPFFFEQADNAIRRVLYKFNAPLYIKDTERNEIRIVGEESIETVLKHNNKEIALGFFTDGRMKEISAIIFSNTATTTKVKALDSANHPNTIFYATRYQEGAWDTPYRVSGIGGEFKETLLDGLHLYLNPFADVPIDPTLFFSEEITLHDFDPEENIPVEYVNDGALLTHGCISFHSPEALEDLKTMTGTTKFKDYSFDWEEDKLYPLSANVGPGINNHLAHYCGWTIVVFQDSIDKDWGAYAKGVLVYTIQHFISLKDDHGMLDTPDFYKTKEEAFSVIKDKIKGIIKSANS